MGMLEPSRFLGDFTVLVAYFRHHLPVHLHAEAEDLAQETLVATWAALRKPAETVRDPIHYLRGVAHNKAAEASRRDYRRRFMSLDQEIEPPVKQLIEQASTEHKLMRAELGTVLRRALASLPAIEAQFLRLRFGEGLSNEAASDRLGISAEEGSRLKYVALQKLRVILKVRSPQARPLRLRAVR